MDHLCSRFLIAAALTAATAVAQDRVVDPNLHHLRAAGDREWSDFAERPAADRWKVEFAAAKNHGEHTLRLRQQDVKQPWRVQLNGKEVGRLALDENDTITYYSLPTEALIDGRNTLVVEPLSKAADDIRVGELAIIPMPRKEVLGEATVNVRVVDSTHVAGAEATPCRITIVDSDGALMTTSATSNETLAARPGVIYSGNGVAQFGLPAGEYTVYAGRGFEYSVDAKRVTLRPGDVIHQTLSIRREVPTEGYVSCDTHIHTLTFSGHGDATIDERMITLAGEGIELPIATDHNCFIDYEPFAQKLGLRKWFTPVVGDEVTTAFGHFNIFPVDKRAAVPDFRLQDGNAVFDDMVRRTHAQAIVLNHPRDIHLNFRPFGPENHNAATGEHRYAWLDRAGAIELVNSGAQQTDVLQTYRDWFALLNRGVIMTPVGASDSHDVSRFIVGQGRTYIRCRDDRPSQIEIDQAVRNFVAGRVLVSCGLLVDITVNDTYGPGDLAPASDELRVSVRVLGPGWTQADHVALYANGISMEEVKIDDGGRAGVKWSGEWNLPRPRHDVHLVAVATGPGVTGLYWPIAKPYQPVSPNVHRRVIGSTGAVWFDADGDGKRTSARQYAERIAEQHSDSTSDFIVALSRYDEAVATHAAALLHQRGVGLDDSSTKAAARRAGEHVERGFTAFFRAWRASEVARSK
jgi:hypothetical protein